MIYPLLQCSHDSLQATDQEMFDDIESRLSDDLSMISSVDVDMDVFKVDNESHPETDRFSAQGVLPLEIIEMIATNIGDDADLLSFILTCKDFALAAVLEESTVWRNRFLARYDHPIIEEFCEFRAAYQLRELVLRKFPSFADGGGARAKIALEVLRDMVVETYHDPQNTKPKRSRNLDILSSPTSAPYMEELLLSPFFAYKMAPYGKKNRLFAALQIVFSHLLLHPESDFAATVRASRGNYDLTIIYLYDLPLSTIYFLQPSELEEAKLHQPKMKLDLNALLHIRNFWQAHLAYEVTERYVASVSTYGEMSRTLVQQNHAPREWDRPIQQSPEVLPHWFGHYSCTHPNPRKIMDIEEHQTCAEDWINQYGEDGVHPLTLDIAITTLPQYGWWPPIFATVPMLESTTPYAGNSHLYLRGVAPFLSPSKEPDLYPRYTALRVRGVIHSLPDQQEIPGWRRIVMVLYAPTSRYLLNVLDENSPHEEEDAFGQVQAILALQASSMTVTQDAVAGQGVLEAHFQPETPDLLQHQAQNVSQGQIGAANPGETEKTLKEELEAREELKGPLGPAYLTRDFIAKMEDNLHPPEELSWDDINYAYVYEGVIIPGGRIMMGRYWRFGAPSVIPGFEQGEGAERGPWVFWC